MKHQKHHQLVKPDSGRFHRSEFAFLGSNCKVIRDLMTEVAKKMNPHFNICFIDAEHSEDKFLNRIQLRDKIFDYNFDLFQGDHDNHINTADADAAFINGNHYSASRQIVIIHKEKEESLRKRMEKLTNVIAVILLDETEPFEFIREKIEKDTPIFSFDAKDDLSKIISESISNDISKIVGLVLAGGQSKRMGSDKSQINYNGKPQEKYLLELFEEMEIEAFLSKREADPHNRNIIEDSFIDLGPFGAICSAFRMNPNNAYLTVACDLPYVDRNALENLISERDPSKVATCYQSANKQFPDPLLTIYEPRAYLRFLYFLSRGYTCPRKVLINSDVKKILIDNDRILTNMNTPNDLESFKSSSSTNPMDAHSPN